MRSGDQIDPQDANAWTIKGIALYDLGKYDEAIQAYDQAIRINPQFAEAWYNKGVALTALGKYDEAIKACDQAISINPQFAEAWYNKGVVLKALGKYDEAIKAFEIRLSALILSLPKPGTTKALPLRRSAAHPNQMLLSPKPRSWRMQPDLFLL
ncbi:tetratricopeptide repeat protein [Methanothrix soehngenii]|uniref:tetratricopeptide repeat protein n=1 Tax=Methanothrix soehngenii TaxID=2223 RepID=UPI00300BFF22